jgi:putative PIG3 family NAD(P)H quinone oxidoreductase
MKAIAVLTHDEQPRLQWQEAAAPACGPEEVLVGVRATAVNRADLSQARGSYPPPPGVTDILGLEMAGTILEVGDAVRGWLPGDRICALLSGGGYAEQVAVHQEMLLRLPDEWTFEQGAAVPEVWYTAYLNLFLEGGLRRGEDVLIHAAASGVGTAAIQLGREAGATTYATAGTEAKLALCRELGAIQAINYKEQNFGDAVLAATGGRGVDLILDPVGGNYLERNIQLLKPGGRLVLIGLLGGASGPLDLGSVLRGGLRIIGSRLRSRPLAEKIAITRDFRRQVWPLLVAGTMRPIIDRVFPISQAQEAHTYVRRNENAGKVILTVAPADR